MVLSCSYIASCPLSFFKPSKEVLGLCVLVINDIMICLCRDRYDDLLNRFNQLLLQKNPVQQDDSDPKAKVCELCLKMDKLWCGDL